jgi:hypothetical protein
MVLAELGGRISAALQSMTNATVIDEAVLKECLKEIASALLQVWNIQQAYVIVLSIVVAPPFHLLTMFILQRPFWHHHL